MFCRFNAIVCLSVSVCVCLTVFELSLCLPLRGFCSFGPFSSFVLLCFVSFRFVLLVGCDECMYGKALLCHPSLQPISSQSTMQPCQSTSKSEVCELWVVCVFWQWQNSQQKEKRPQTPLSTSLYLSRPLDLSRPLSTSLDLSLSLSTSLSISRPLSTFLSLPLCANMFCLLRTPGPERTPGGG